MKKYFSLLLCLFCSLNVSAQYNLEKGREYYNRQNYIQALSYLQNAAKEGYGEACYLLADMYYYGRGPEINYTIALRMYQRGLEYGYSRGEAEIGQIYQYGNGVPADIQKALAYYEKSIAKGDLWGKCRLAWCYYYGHGVEQDYDKAFPLFKDAAETYLYAKKMTGECYEYGRGVAQDYQQAADYYAQSEDPAAIYRSALIRYIHDRDTNPHSKNYAYVTILKAIEAGYQEPEAYYYAGLWQENYRKYCTKAAPEYWDYNPKFCKTAPMILVTHAAEAGYGPAQKLLGDWFREGLYTAVNLPLAKKWYAKAKANGEEVPEL